LGSALYDEFKRTSDDQITKGRWFSISAVLSLPTDICFNIHSFGDDSQLLSEESRKEWSLAGGTDGFIGFECDGYISHPEPFVAKTANLLINPLGSLDRFKLNEKGSIGNGWYDGQIFLFRLYLELKLTQQLLSLIQQQPNLFGQSSSGLLGQIQRDATGHDPSGCNIRFDLFNLKYQEINDSTFYDIYRIYI
jgi:hypothetical protein